MYAALYRLAISGYGTMLRVAALFNHKAKLFVTGRNHIFDRMSAELANESRPRVWMHCASLGEFEQGRSVLENIRKQYPAYAIVLTFFSPSGYEVRKHYDGADHVFYLPIDTNHNAQRFLDIVKPSLCLFVKYEFWYYYLANMAKRNIPILLVSGIFRQDHPFFKWYGKFHRGMLQFFTHIFLQDAASAALLESIHVTQYSISGDTRFDRVLVLPLLPKEYPIANAFCADNKIIVAGSTWPKDETFLHNAMKKISTNWKMILVPHEVHEAHIAEIEKIFQGDTIRWSQWYDESDKKVLIVDKVGFLSHLYHYGRIAWIGGGFDKEGVHNVLEAAVYGLPCFYGPVYERFLEAKELIERGGAFTLNTVVDFTTSVKELEDSIRYEHASHAAKHYVFANSGATEKIMKYIADGAMLS